MKRKSASSKSVIVPICIAIPILTFLLALAAGKLVLSELLPEAATKYLPAIITGIVSLLLSMFAAIKMKQKKFLWGIGTAVIYLLMLLISNLLFFGEGYDGILPVAGAVLGCGLIGSLLGAGKRRKYA